MFLHYARIFADNCYHKAGMKAILVVSRGGCMKSIGRYRIQGLLGRGGMGRVYKAVLPVVDKVVALKHFHPHEHMLSLLGAEKASALFHTEARILARISHPNIASLLDFDYDSEGRAFFVMEYLCMNLGSLIGETYDVETPARRLSPERVIAYARQLLSGLDRLHQAGIIHRDIKPYNLLLTEDDQLKIIDMGLSRLRGEIRSFPDSLKIGTPFYAAPEQERAPERADARSDLYSVGVVLWRMLTGELPEKRDKVRRASEIVPLLGYSWDSLLYRAIAPDPSERFSDSLKMQQALDDAFAGWRRDMEKACRRAPCGGDGEMDASGRRPRTRPLKVPLSEARETFGLDRLYRPAAVSPARFEGRGDECVLDATHGLVWQKGASPYPLSWHEAFDHIRRINEEGFSGITGWRLPTIDELITLLHSFNAIGDFCQPPPFDAAKNRLWSADRKSFTSAWMVDTDGGCVISHDRSCRFYVRAVSMLSSMNSRIM